ncbi:cyclic-AMP phosphodiesterase [Polyporus arcularius HHB13444]|uniref:Cyclic-AMP phosphodiesterase n=1 Tax=Polyporus arcularius HHB13444 TaxID=1314778 RepID=A0A5C3PGQ4_9APHY|nr:cyclic-AMP phosphodiesterase [Polyporus arcularius HHB13444]
MTSFDIVVVGCGGGPSENNLSSYLLKAADATWEDGIVALEAGSGIGALTRLLDLHPDVFAPEPSEPEADVQVITAADIYSRIRCYLITHSHLDHVNGLVLSAGSVQGPTKLVHGSKRTLEGVASIFSGEIWPKLASWKEAEVPGTSLLLSPLSPDEVYTSVAHDISVRMMPISHGQNDGIPYPCTAFFVRHDSTNREFLFFGDVEPDSISSEPKNLEIWRVAAPKIPETLSAIFIECSWPLGRADDILYGHLSPKHLAQELTALALEVVSSRQRASTEGRSNGASKKKKRNTDSLPSLEGALAGLRVYITHCKDDIQKTFDKPIHEVIASQVRELVDAKGLGAEIIAVEQGLHISASSISFFAHGPNVPW